ncbi:MAG: response regulator receiver protein [Bacteroidota bacterium]|jgi:CheY-like chemotaxis protein|nr:response regulator receiver protein [Bacteroidota bacterium]
MAYKKILLVDDDEDDQEIFLSAVNEVSENAECLPLSDATEALAKLSAKEIEPDVIFLDLNMPVMNGQQFLVEIKKREELKKIPVIIFSTSSHLATIQLMKDLGAADFITKPDKYDELVKILSSRIL